MVPMIGPDVPISGLVKSIGGLGRPKTLRNWCMFTRSLLSCATLFSSDQITSDWPLLSADGVRWEARFSKEDRVSVRSEKSQNSSPTHGCKQDGCPEIRTRCFIPASDR